MGAAVSLPWRPGVGVGLAVTVACLGIAACGSGSGSAAPQGLSGSEVGTSANSRLRRRERGGGHLADAGGGLVPGGQDHRDGAGLHDSRQRRHQPVRDLAGDRRRSAR